MARVVDPLAAEENRPSSTDCSATSGDVAATIDEVIAIETDEVRGTTRSVRRGYVVDAATQPGDSGAGVYDEEGRLVGLLFGVSTGDGRRSWVTAAEEIEAFLAEAGNRSRFACDAEQSRVIRLDDERQEDSGD